MKTLPDLEVLTEESDHAFDAEEMRMLDNMLGKFNDEIIKPDIEKYVIRDLEHKFEVPAEDLLAPVHSRLDDVMYVGSIDHLFQERDTTVLFADELKTCKGFKTDLEAYLDPQLRFYDVVLAQQLIKKLDYQGIFLTEVKKLKTKLNMQRTLFRHTEKQQNAFLQGIDKSTYQILENIHGDIHQAEPGWMSCKICDFAPLCRVMSEKGMNNVWDILPKIEEYGFYQRTEDHLEEKE